MTAVRVSPLTADDHEAWLALWRGYQVFYKVDLAPKVTATTWARMLDPAEPVAGNLAWEGDRALGLVHTIIHRNTWTVGDTCYLNDLYVVPEVRTRGIGRKLIEYVYAMAKAAGCEGVYWHTQETNATAMQLYNRVAERSGFVQYAKTLA
jgi:GNAT superfamily N-acetyltransferase